MEHLHQKESLKENSQNQKEGLSAESASLEGALLSPPTFQLKNKHQEEEGKETEGKESEMPKNDISFDYSTSKSAQLKSGGEESEHELETEPSKGPYQFSADDDNDKDKNRQKVNGPYSSSKMPDSIQTKMESSFGTDFSDVNIHSNSNQAEDIGALAYTQGTDVHFAPGQYNPQSQKGQELLGHELTHVVQQKQGRVKPTTQAKGLPVNSDPGLEHEANMMGKNVIQNKKSNTPSVDSLKSDIQSQTVQMHPGGGSTNTPNSGTSNGNSSTEVTTPEGTSPSVEPREGEQTTVPENTTDTSEATQAAVLAFKSRIYGPQNVSTSIGGRFNASYYPFSERLFIDLSMGVDFMDVLNIDSSNNVTINSSGDPGTDAQFTLARTAAMAVPVARRAAFVQNYQWSAGEKTSKMTDLTARNTEAEGIWSNKHTFFVDKPGWHDVKANVTVSINEHETSTPADQLQNSIFKTPPGLDIGAWVNMAGNASQQGNMTLDDDEVAAPSGGGLLEWNVLFANDSAFLNRNARTLLNQFVVTFSDDAKANQSDRNASNNSVDNKVMNKITLVGHASSTGSSDYNEKLAKRRMKAVKAHLTARGLHGVTEGRVESQNKGEEGATEDASWRRVDLIVGDGKAQNVVAHELGHVFGLDDEYATQSGSLISGTGNPTGTQVSHDGLSGGIGAPNATAENNDGIMSLGNNVRAQHYSTFGAALQQITSTPEWRIIMA
jgi:outer membrane protein OmpA-like peptidoglycan-associated protein